MTRPVHMAKLDKKGRCCGRKPIFYKGGNWRSPLSAPMYFCTRCDREFGPDGNQRRNFAWRETEHGFLPVSRLRAGE